MTFDLGRLGLGDTVKGFLAALMLLAGLILLAACANLGSLFAARAADRSKEVALRLALGSTRKRVLRGLFTEAILISLIGGSVGLWASVVLLHALRGWQPFPEWPINVPITPDKCLLGSSVAEPRERFPVLGCPSAAYGSVSNHQVGDCEQWRTPIYGARSVAHRTNCDLCGTGDFVTGCSSRASVLSRIILYSVSPCQE
jgi:FtsX-like permease family